jgi:flagellar hook-associated protein 2
VSTPITTTFQPQFTASGLISGLDTGSMVTQLTALAGAPITQLQTQETAIKAQISAEASLSSQLSALGTLATSLSTAGVVASSAQTSSSAFTATATAGAGAGRYTLQVTQLAQAANDRSQSFSSASGQVSGGTLNLSVGGKTATVTITDGMQLGDVAKAINASGLRISATILSTGTSAYLSVTTLDTGFDPTTTADSALQMTETTTGTSGQPLTMGVIASAKNAQFTLDGLSFSRQSNTITDAINGVTLNLNALNAAPDDLVVSTDPTGSQANLQGFVDAYNSLVTSLNAQIAPGAGADSSTLLSGNSAVRSLLQELQSLTSATTGSTGSIRSLADIGVQTDFTTGTLTIDQTAFQSALAANPQGMKDLFSAASTGINAQVQTVVTRYTDPVDGVFVNDTQGMNDTITQTDDDIANLQLSVDSYHDRLAASFASMESIISDLKTNASFLTQAFDALNPSSSSSK